jgi:protoheme ferro-lyase
VLLVHEDAPRAAEAVAPFLRARLSREGVLGWPWSWLGGLGARIVAWWRARKLAPAIALLPGPSPRVDALAGQARALQKVLGRRYTCHPVLHGGRPDAAAAAAGVGKGEQVVIVPMDPICGPILRAGASAARRAVKRNTDKVHWTGPWSDDAGYLEAMAECLRLAIHRQPGGGAYRVLFVSNGEAEGKAGDRARRAAADVAHAAGVRAEWALAFLPDFGMAADPLGDALDALPTGGGTLVVQHLGATSEHRDTVVSLDRLLAEAAAERGLVWTRASAPGARPTFIHALAARVQHVEREVEWTVPEDRLRADVAAAWAAIDAGEGEE